jgi:hypothetical protein
LYCLAIGATTFAVSETYLGRDATVRGAYGRVRTRIWKILAVVANIFLRMIGMFAVAAIAMGIIVAVSAILTRSQVQKPAVAIFLGVLFLLAYLAVIGFVTFWSMRYAVSISALLLEDTGVTVAIKRSVQLTSGRRGQIFVAIVLSSIVGYAGVIIFQGPLLVASVLSAQGGHPAAWLIFLSSALGAVGGAITMPVLMIVLVLCYYDSRIRKEAFDLQFLMSLLDSSPRGQNVVTPA